MKKNIKVLIAVIAVIALLVGGIIAVVMMGTDGDVTEPAATPNSVQQYDAYKIERDEIDSFTINFENEKVTFKNTGEGTWSVNSTSYDELDSTKVESLLMCVCTMMSNHEIEKGAQDLAKYGLDTPAVTVDVKRTDGTSDRLLIGDVSPTLGENFFTVEGSGNIYTIYTYKVDMMTEPASYYMTYDRFNVKIDDVTNIKLERRGMDTLEVRTKDIDQNDGYSVVWEVVQPYSQVFNGIDQFINDKILTPIDELSISAPADEGIEYGFDNPSATITVTVETYNEQTGEKTEPKIEKIVVGNSADGLSYIQYKDKAYAVSKTAVEFAYTDSFLAVSKLQALVDIQNTDKMTVTSPNGTTVMEINHGSAATDITFKVNGNEADSKLSKQIYQEIIAMNIDSVYNGEQMQDAEVIIEFDGYNGSDDVKVELKPINELNYALVRNGETYFVIKKTKVDEILTKLAEYVQNPMGTE